MAEPKSEQIVEQIVTYLNAIRGDGGETYWYTPVAVRADHIDIRLLDSSLETVYAVTADHTEEKRASNDGPGCIIDATSFYVLTLLGKLKAATTNPFVNSGVLRKETVQQRMAADVRKKLRADPRLNGLSIDLRLSASQENASETAIEGWAAVFMDVAVRFHYVKENPAA